eukprot:TRINITY_DN21393_c0_g1_i1.p1 TRINITY_DN21393_c0_g1~~TRINITY_DN21393_c0_g1_i1.p1  ORF type:complete len:644 (+),score=135.68 TRINITY_DN21393_c0_g1_i1:235-1932(+)
MELLRRSHRARPVETMLAMRVPQFYTQWIASSTIVAPAGVEGPHVTGVVNICQGDLISGTREAYDDVTQTVLFDFQNLDPRCFGSAALQPAAEDGRQPPCTLAVVSDTQCGSGWDAPHVALWNLTYAQEDPWRVALLNVNSSRSAKEARQRSGMPHSPGYASGAFTVRTGLQLWTLVDHTLSITDADGRKVACSQLVTSCKVVFRLCVHVWARILAVIAGVVGVITSAVHINNHLRNNKLAALRNYTVRILLIVPLYSIEASVALFLKVTPLNNELLKTCRELYEAVVIFSFLQFILCCCGGPRRLTSAFDEQGRELKHLPGFGYILPRWRSAEQMLSWCIIGTLSYVVVGVLASCAGFVLFVLVLQDEFFVSWLEVETKVGNMCLSASQALAIMSLAELADNLMEDLKVFRPFPKFLSVKAVVFFTFWQANILKVLVKLGFFSQFQDERYGWISQELIADAVQNFLIVLEMCAASIIHVFVFPTDDYELVLERHNTEPDRSPSFLGKRLAVVDFRDIVSTVMSGVVCGSPSDDEDDEEEGSSDEDDYDESSADGAGKRIRFAAE